MSRRAPSVASTLAKSRSLALGQAAWTALQAGATLRVSNHSDIAAGVVHRNTAARLVRGRLAHYLPDAAREGCLDTTRIVRVAPIPTSEESLDAVFRRAF